MKKKIWMFAIGLFAISLVAAIGYYAFFSTTFTVLPSIVIGECDDTLGDVYDGETYEGEDCTITNNAPSERTITISEDSDEDVVVSYVGTLELTKKTVDFASDNWAILSGKVQVEYTIIGDEFSAEVVGGYEEGYALVYYADEDDRFANPGETVLIENVVGNLPSSLDANADLNDYSNEYPKTPHGAKIWYVPLASVGVVDWSDASNFYFETALIQFNAEGNLVIYPGQTLTIKPVYEIGDYVTGEYTITTTVA